MNVVKAAYDWATENMEKKDPYRVEPMNETEGLIMITGNEAAALGCCLWRRHRGGLVSHHPFHQRY
jgi:hypothetical protein